MYTPSSLPFILLYAAVDKHPNSQFSSTIKLLIIDLSPTIDYVTIHFTR
jgi:hypothetical protein